MGIYSVKTRSSQSERFCFGLPAFWEKMGCVNRLKVLIIVAQSPPGCIPEAFSGQKTPKRTLWQCTASVCSSMNALLGDLRASRSVECAFLSVLSYPRFLLSIHCTVGCITWEVEGFRPRGHPKKTWWDCIKNDMESLGLSQKDAQSRNKWRRIKGATG